MNVTANGRIERLALLLGLTERHIWRLVKAGTIPTPAKPGCYDVDACVIAYIQHLRKGSRREGGDILTERTGLVRAQREQAELDLQVARGELVPATTAEAAFDDLVAAARARLLGIPSRGASLVMGAANVRAAEAQLKRLIWEALEELARPGPDDESGEGAVGATADADGEPVGGGAPAAKPRGQRRAG